MQPINNKRQQQNRRWTDIKYNRSTLGHSMQCKPHTAHIHQSKIDQLIGMAPSRGCGVCKALFGIQERRGQRGEKKKKRSITRHAPEATGRGGCGGVLCPPGVAPLWPGTDCVSGSPHSSVAVCAAALQLSTSSPEVSGPPLGAERPHTYHSLASIIMQLFFFFKWVLSPNALVP